MKCQGKHRNSYKTYKKCATFYVTHFSRKGETNSGREVISAWMPIVDSNNNYKIQSFMCYHYTNRQYTGLRNSQPHSDFGRLRNLYINPTTYIPRIGQRQARRLVLKPTLSVVEHLELKLVFAETKPWIKAPHFQQRNALLSKTRIVKQYEFRNTHYTWQSCLARVIFIQSYPQPCPKRKSEPSARIRTVSDFES